MLSTWPSLSSWLSSLFVPYQQWPNNRQPALTRGGGVWPTLSGQLLPAAHYNNAELVNAAARGDGVTSVAVSGIDDRDNVLTSQSNGLVVMMTLMTTQRGRGDIDVVCVISMTQRGNDIMAK